MEERGNEKISWNGPYQGVWFKEHADAGKINSINGKFKEESRYGILYANKIPYIMEIKWLLS